MSCFVDACRFIPYLPWLAFWTDYCLMYQGSEDPTFPKEQAEYETKMFTGSRDASLIVVKGGWHFLHRSHPRDVNMSVICFVKAYSNSDR